MKSLLSYKLPGSNHVICEQDFSQYDQYEIPSQTMLFYNHPASLEDLFDKVMELSFWY